MLSAGDQTAFFFLGGGGRVLGGLCAILSVQNVNESNHLFSTLAFLFIADAENVCSTSATLLRNGQNPSFAGTASKEFFRVFHFDILLFILQKSRGWNRKILVYENSLAKNQIPILN